MFSSIFSLITLLLKLLGLWEKFLDHADATRLSDSERRRQIRDAAIDSSTRATTPEEAYAAQEDITRNSP